MNTQNEVGARLTLELVDKHNICEGKGAAGAYRAKCIESQLGKAIWRISYANGPKLDDVPVPPEDAPGPFLERWLKIWLERKFGREFTVKAKPGSDSASSAEQ